MIVPSSLFNCYLVTKIYQFIVHGYVLLLWKHNPLIGYGYWRPSYSNCYYCVFLAFEAIATLIKKTNVLVKELNYQHLLIRYLDFSCSCVYLACISVQFLNVAFDQITKSNVSQKNYHWLFFIVGVIILIDWYSLSNNWLLEYSEEKSPPEEQNCTICTPLMCTSSCYCFQVLD